MINELMPRDVAMPIDFVFPDKARFPGIPPDISVQFNFPVRRTHEVLTNHKFQIIFSIVIKSDKCNLSSMTPLVFEIKTDN